MGVLPVIHFKTRCSLRKHPAMGVPQIYIYIYMEMGLSENSVPLNPMVNDHYPY